MLRTLFLLSCCFFPLFSVGMVVESPSLLAQMLKQYQQYVDMIEKAQAQVNKLNEINDMMNKANNIMNKQSLTIANPLEVMENLKSTLASIKYNAQRLAQTAKDYEIGKTIKFKNLQSKCPFLDLNNITPDTTKIEVSQIGEETKLKEDVQNLLNEFTDITAYDVSSLSGSIKGLPLAILMCEKLQAYEKAIQSAEYEDASRTALLNGDYEEYKKQQQEKIQYIVAKEIEEQNEFEKKLAPLKVRMEQMKINLGVLDKNLAQSNGIKYCEPKNDGSCEPILLSLDYIKNKEKEMIEKWANNSNSDQSQSQADREFIMIDYLREIASHMAFLNETMALTANYLVTEKERSQNTAQKNMVNDDTFQDRVRVLQDQVESSPNAIIITERSPNLDDNGFPIFETTKENSSSSF